MIMILTSILTITLTMVILMINTVLGSTTIVITIMGGARASFPGKRTITP